MFKNFPEQWQDLLKEKGITTETAIQKELFAPITEGDNVLGISLQEQVKPLPTFFHFFFHSSQKKLNNCLS